MGPLFLLLLVTIALWGAASYRRLVSMRKQLLVRWSLIDLHLRTRHDLVLGLVNAVRSAMAFEREALAGIMEARERAIGAAGPVDAARKEEDLSLAIERLFAAAAGYPTLDAHREIVAIRDELSAVGKKIRAAQQSYNDTAGQYNAAQRIFPFSLLASQLGLRQAEGLQPDR